MRIGICSPITISEFLPYCDEKSRKVAAGLIGLMAPSVDALVHRFLAIGYDVVIFTLSPEVSKSIVLTGKHLKIYIGRYRKLGILRSHTLFFSEIVMLRRFIRNEPCLDVMHAHWTYEFAIGALAAKCPVVCTIRDVAEEVLKLIPTFYRRARKWMNDYVLRQDGVVFIANSPYTKKRILEYHPALEIAAIIPNPCGLPVVDAVPDRSEYPLRCVSVSQGRGRLKNIDTLVGAFSRVREQYPDAELHLIGPPFRMEEWGDKPVPPGVVLCGPVPHTELGEAFRTATVMMHPSLEESFGNVLIEAMACGLPVIGGKTSGAVPYVLDYGKAGILCDVTDENAIASEILNLFQNPTDRYRLAVAGIERVKTTFSVVAVASQTLELYKSVLKSI